MMPRFRRRIAALARGMPPAHITQRLVPWVTLLAALITATWALLQYSNDLAIRRVSTTLEMHRQFRTGYRDSMVPLQSAMRDANNLPQRILDLRCGYLQKLQADGTLLGGVLPVPECGTVTVENISVLDPFSLLLSAEQRTDLRQMVEVLMAAQDDAPLGAYGELVDFFRSVRLCVGQNTCDPATTLALFEFDIVAMLNMTCAAVKADTARRSEAVLLARFVRDLGTPARPYWSADTGQTDPFLCDYLRVTENQLQDKRRTGQPAR